MMRLHCVLLVLSVAACSLAMENSRTAREAVRTPKFTRQQILAMIEGMDNGGKTYNFQGVEATEDDTYILSRAQLSALLQQTEPLRTPEFTKQQVEDMIAGTEEGKSYNYQGVEVGADAPNILTMDLLNILLETNKAG